MAFSCIAMFAIQKNPLERCMHTRGSSLTICYRATRRYQEEFHIEQAQSLKKKGRNNERKPTFLSGENKDKRDTAIKKNASKISEGLRKIPRGSNSDFDANGLVTILKDQLPLSSARGQPIKDDEIIMGEGQGIQAWSPDISENQKAAGLALKKKMTSQLAAGQLFGYKRTKHGVSNFTASDDHILRSNREYLEYRQQTLAQDKDTMKKVPPRALVM
jgi:hypothetical protein